MKVLVAYMNRRFAAIPYGYAPAILLVSDVAVLVVATGAVVQRDGFSSPGWALVGGLIASTHVLWLVSGLPVPDVRVLPVLLTLAGLVGTGVLLADAKVAADLAPLLIVLMAGEIAATAPMRISIPAATAGAALLATAGLLGRVEDTPLYVTVVALGWMVGFIVQNQRIMLDQERALQAERAVQAAGDERRRIAREVHDVIAHSLSVTLLHLTGARRALQEDRDVDDAVDALTDAERLGRQAMADIRRTVGLLDAEPAAMTPEPAVSDIDELVTDFVRAGVQVRYEVTGAPEAVSAATGLALYRITQESLANVVKHAPGATATVGLVIGTVAALTIANDTPAGPAVHAGRGSGVQGMRQRAELLGGKLRAGPKPGGWLVRAEFPISAGGSFCLREKWGLQ